MNQEILGKIEDHLERTMDAWYNSLPPGRVLEQVICSQGVRVARMPLERRFSAYSADLNTIYIHDDLAKAMSHPTNHLAGVENVLLVREWHNLRVHRRTGGAPKQSSKAFLEACCREWLLPRHLLENHQSFIDIQDWWVARADKPAKDLWIKIYDLAEEFVASPTFVCRALINKGLLLAGTPSTPLRLNPVLPDNLVRLFS